MAAVRPSEAPCYHLTGHDKYGFSETNVGTNRGACMRCIFSNPDVRRRANVNCVCGREIKLSRDWYVLSGDGCAVCSICACCSCCHVRCTAVNRRLTSLGGFILCYPCLQKYGFQSERAPPFLPLPTFFDDDFLNNRNNPQIPNDPKPEMSDWMLMQLQEDPRIKPPAYTAQPTELACMTCPGCGLRAKGKSKLIVASIARVFHTQCFRCCECGAAFPRGVRFPQKNFFYCSCIDPQLWCPSLACNRKRLEHHKANTCHLGPIHPGGRI